MHVAKEALAKKLLQPERAHTPWITSINLTEVISVRVATGSWGEKGPNWPGRTGLYVPYSLFDDSPREFIKIVYVMGCGQMVQTVLRKKDFPLYKLTYQRSKGETGQAAVVDGFLVPFDLWDEFCKLDDLAVKEGDKKSLHYASKPGSSPKIVSSELGVL